MIDTALLVPPGFGPNANPLLFGVAEGLTRLFPLPETGPASAGAGTATGRIGTAGEGGAPREAASPREG